MKKINIDSTHSDHKGIKGLFESTLRRFKSATHLVTMIPVYGLACLILGLSLTPGIFVFRWVAGLVEQQSPWLQNLSYGVVLALAYFMYGFSLIFLTPIANAILRGYLKTWRGPYHSAESLKWFIHNGLTYLVRYTFLEFVTPSPVSLLFYKMMGMKIGHGTVINTTWISDPSMIELGKKVTLGGSATLVAHYGQGGLLVLAPVKIGDGTTVGLKATVMGGAEIGANVKILPHSVVLPKTKIPDGETWGGVPAQKIDSLRESLGKNKTA